jgi:hypothetical protein
MTAGAAFSDPPNQCIQPFQVATDQRARLLGAKAVVTCGGLPRGQVSVCIIYIVYIYIVYIYIMLGQRLWSRVVASPAGRCQYV